MPHAHPGMCFPGYPQRGAALFLFCGQAALSDRYVSFFLVEILLGKHAYCLRFSTQATRRHHRRQPTQPQQPKRQHMWRQLLLRTSRPLPRLPTLRIHPVKSRVCLKAGHRLSILRTWHSVPLVKWAHAPSAGMRQHCGKPAMRSCVILCCNRCVTFPRCTFAWSASCGILPGKKMARAARRADRTPKGLGLRVARSWLRREHDEEGPAFKQHIHKKT